MDSERDRATQVVVVEEEEEEEEGPLLSVIITGLYTHTTVARAAPRAPHTPVKQKRPASAKETYLLGKRDLLAQKRPTCSKETYLLGKRDLLARQKRPNA